MRRVTTCLLAALASTTGAAVAAPALAPVADLLERGDPEELMAEARLRTDLGRVEEAATLHRAVADADGAGPALRGEALARLGAALRDLGRMDDARAAFAECLDRFGDEPEVLRFLSLAVNGVEVAPAVAARGAVLEDGEAGRPRLRWNGRPADACVGEGRGEAISLNVEDADLGDLFRLFGEVAGMNIVVDRCVAENQVTLVLDDVPWDQALRLLIQSQGYSCTTEDGVMRVRCPEAASGLRRAERVQVDRDGTVRLIADGAGPHAVEWTVRGLRTVALAANAHAVDHGRPPAAREPTPTGEVASLLEPAYVRALPRVDAWDEPLRYLSTADGVLVASAGPDGILEAETLTDDGPVGDDLSCRLHLGPAGTPPDVTCSGAR